MSDSRRRLLLSFAGAAGVLAVEPLLAALQVPNHPAPQPRPSPNTPNGNYPPGLQGPRPKEPNQKAIDRANQKELRDEVSKLFDRVTELKDQIDKTDATATLSISVVKKASKSKISPKKSRISPRADALLPLSIRPKIPFFAQNS